MVDIHIMARRGLESTMVGFVANTDHATDFMRTMLSTEDWQWLGRVLWVDHRYADGVAQLAAENGLTVGIL